MKRPTPFTPEVRHNPWVLGLSLAPPALLLTLGVLGAIFALPALVCGLFSVPSCRAAAYRGKWLSRRERARGRANADGLTIGHRVYSIIRSGLVVRGNPDRVRLRAASAPSAPTSGPVLRLIA